MSMLRYALPALAAVGAAKAADCSISGTTTIQSGGDASAIASCSTFTGNIAVATGTTGDLTFNNMQRIKGGLAIVNAPNVTSLSGDSITMIDDELRLDNVQTLSGLSMPQLAACGSIVFNALPNLATLDLTTEIQDTTSLNIQNTFLSNLQGINLKECNSFTLANNRMLQDVSLQLQNVSGAITLESNGDRLKVDFPNLQWAQNITFRNVPSISIPSLYAVNGSLGFIENDSLQNVSCPNLTRVDGSLSVNTNDALSSISFPKLTTVKGAVNVENNTELKSVTFPALTMVGGAFDAYGNFSNITLPKINDVRGAFNVQSSEDISKDCDTFGGEQGPNDVIKGDYTCAGTQENPGGAGTTPTGSGSTTSRTGSAADHVIPSTAMTGVLGVVAAIFGLL